MSAQIEAIITDILRREGGYVDNPNDRGGPTNMGITLATLAAWRGKKPEEITRDDVRRLEESEARAIYRQEYVVEPNFVDLPEPLRSLMVDCGVHHNPTRAATWLQKALGVVADGIVGKGTLRALAESNAREVYLRVIAARIRHFGRIITINPNQAEFASGWCNRAAEFVEKAP